MLPEYIAVLEKFKELIAPVSVKEKLLLIKSATIDRRLVKFRTFRHKKVFSTTKPGTLLKKNIPIKTSSWNETRLGYGELDTVAHCGGSAAGEFIFFPYLHGYRLAVDDFRGGYGKVPKKDTRWTGQH